MIKAMGVSQKVAAGLVKVTISQTSVIMKGFTDVSTYEEVREVGS